MRNNLTFSEVALEHNGSPLSDDSINGLADDVVTLWKSGVLDSKNPRWIRSGDTMMVAEATADGILTIYETKIDRVLKIQRKPETFNVVEE